VGDLAQLSSIARLGRGCGVAGVCDRFINVALGQDHYVYFGYRLTNSA
jgi:hypothetical protein